MQAEKGGGSREVGAGRGGVSPQSERALGRGQGWAGPRGSHREPGPAGMDEFPANPWLRNREGLGELEGLSQFVLAPKSPPTENFEILKAGIS